MILSQVMQRFGRRTPVLGLRLATYPAADTLLPEHTGLYERRGGGQFLRYDEPVVVSTCCLFVVTIVLSPRAPGLAYHVLRYVRSRTAGASDRILRQYRVALSVTGCRSRL